MAIIINKSRMDEQKGPSLSSITPRGKENVNVEQVRAFEGCLNSQERNELHLTSVVPGVYYIDNVLNEDECHQLVKQIDKSQSLTFWCEEKKDDASTRSYRDAETIEMQSEMFARELWNRVEDMLNSSLLPVIIKDNPDDESYERDLVGTWKACGTNPLTLFVRYPSHGSFAPHTDGRAILDFNLRSHYSVILFLNTVPQECGAGTRFYDSEAVQKLSLEQHHIYANSAAINQPAQHWTSSVEFLKAEIPAKAGRMAIFHQTWVHEGVPPLPPYKKYIIRSDIIFQRTPAICDCETDRDAYKMFREAEWLAESGENDEAIKLFKKAFRLSPTLARIMGQA